MHAPATMTRTWPMLAALGGGLVLAALAAGAGGAPRVVLAGLGVAALGWGVLSLRSGRPLAPRTVLATSVASLLLGGVAVATGGLADVPGLPLAAAGLFLAAVALPVARAARGRARDRRGPEASAAARTAHAAPATAPAREARRSLVGLAIGAVLVSALATPALAATEAGRTAVPHGEHGGPGLHGGPGGPGGDGTGADPAPSDPAHDH
ncbi:hypothetical protein GCM10009571_31060 [Agromyces luteolus]|uniref:Uncharacterized protein n=1 Tax=Agromyces luteolus TaxID=88373 RepID=A0A7C9LDG9_9MICO|nr:hypothetical protein [Agromyces luteolus]MUN05950.1 hypothetical protein [Agromyces luteolus]